MKIFESKLDNFSGENWEYHEKAGISSQYRYYSIGNWFNFNLRIATKSNTYVRIHWLNNSLINTNFVIVKFV